MCDHWLVGVKLHEVGDKDDRACFHLHCSGQHSDWVQAVHFCLFPGRDVFAREREVPAFSRELDERRILRHPVPASLEKRLQLLFVASIVLPVDDCLHLLDVCDEVSLEGIVAVSA